MKGWITKTGAKYHRESCRFAKAGKEDLVGTRGACAVCKPHLPLGMIPVKSVGKETLRGCTVCKASCADPVTREEAPKLGFSITPTGKCYHTATCKLINRTKGPVKAAPAVKVIKPIKKMNKNAVDNSVLAAIGM